MKGNWLKINGKTLPLEGDIEVESISPFFNRESHILQDGSSITPQGNFSNAISKWTNGEVQNILGHIDKMQIKRQSRMISGVEMISEGRQIEKGNLFFTDIKKNLNSSSVEYQLTLITGDRDDFMQAIKDKTLKGLAMNGVVSIAGGNIFDWGNMNGGTFGSPPFAPAVLGAGFISYLGLVGSPYVDIFAPSGVGYAEFAATAYYASNEITSPSQDYFTFPTLIAYQGDLGDDGQPTLRTINRWSSTGQFDTYRTNIIPAGGNPDHPYTRYTAIDNPIVPMYYYNKVLQHIFSECGFALKPDELLQDADFLKLCFANSYDVKRPLIVRMTNIYNDGVDDDVLYYERDTTITPKNHLPALAITEFLADFMLKFNCYFDVRGNVVTIIHNETEKVQREINDVNPDIEILIEDKVGMVLSYNLDENKSYELEKGFTTPFIDLPVGLGSVAVGDYFLSNVQNAIFKALPFPDVEARVCSNLIPYNSGDSKVFTMPLVAVNCGTILYDKIFPPLIYDTPPPPSVNKQFVPYMYASIGGFGQAIFHYEFGINIGHPGFSELYQSYLCTLKEESDETIADDINMIGFYHGLYKSGDVADAFPYMTYHNYQVKGFEVKLGNWHLGIIGNEGLIDTYWKQYTNVFNNARKFIIQADENFETIKKHKWNQSVVCRGTQLYISVIKFKLPLRQFPIYECYEI